MKYLRENYNVIEEGIDEMEQSINNVYSKKILTLEISLGVKPDIY